MVMSKSTARTPGNDVRTLGYVLRRTNYGEADRILNIITPEGKVTAIAKGVRKPKSKLAGGIEMFSLIDFNIHSGKSEFGIVTSAKMLKYYDELLKDYAKMELVGVILKKISQVSESSNDSCYFEMVDQCMKELNDGASKEMVEAWFWLNLARVMGEEVNLYRDVNGEKLQVDARYGWDVGQSAFYEKTNGEYGADEIKMLRIMATSKLSVARKVKMTDEFMYNILGFVRMATGA